MTPREASERQRVVAEALSWFGTPYHHHGRVRGKRGGVDCAQLLLAVYGAVGLVDALDPGFYPHDHHLHRSEELYIEWLQRAGAVEVQAPAMGDVALYRFGRTWSHGAIVVAEDRQVLHSYHARGVILTRQDEDPLQARTARWWTLWRPAA